MKKFTRSFSQVISRTTFILLAIIFIHVNVTFAQEKQSVTGKLTETKTNQPVPFATVALIRESDSAMITGGMSDDSGVFTITPVLPGKYRLRVSIIGYQPFTKSIIVGNSGVTDAGVIKLEETTIMLKELTVFGERVKAKSESNKTTFFVTKKILDASGTGTDVLKFIPGIQVDLMQNITLEGSRNIQVLVDGKERDAGFVSQLNPGRIDRVEVIAKSSSGYDGNTTGAINIILKKEQTSGVSGQLYTEIPASGSEIYLRPAFSLNWVNGKLNLYTSYKGELTYLDLQESTYRKSWNSSGTSEIVSNQYVRQKDWSHRFNIGVDYFLNAHNQLNFYAYYNPFSRELDGNTDLQMTGSKTFSWNARKEDTDMNTSTFWSLYYKHDGRKEGRAITMEISDYTLNGKNSTSYIPQGSETGSAILTNTTEPNENILTIKMDYSTRLWNKLNFSSGIKTKFQVLHDKYSTDFYYDEQIYAAYGTIAYNQLKYDIILGLRVEKSITNLKDKFTDPVLSFFPDFIFNYKLTTRQHVQLSYSRSIRRPDIYQLNPYTAIDDPYSVSKGNPWLQPEYSNGIFLEYSIRIKNNYFASRLFYNHITDVINNLTFINDTGAFETQVHNMGTMDQYGIQFSGTFRLGILSFNPYLQVFRQYSCANNVAKQYGIENRQNQGFNSGLSAILSFRHDISVSAVVNYTSPKYNMQGSSFSDALYFLSIDKTFKQKIKIGIVCALPLTKTFTYQGSDINGPDFSSHYEGNVKISNPFCWLKLSYQFSSGKNREKTERATEEMENSRASGVRSL